MTHSRKITILRDLHKNPKKKKKKNAIKHVKLKMLSVKCIV